MKQLLITYTVDSRISRGEMYNAYIIYDTGWSNDPISTGIHLLCLIKEFHNKHNAKQIHSSESIYIINSMEL